MGLDLAEWSSMYEEERQQLPVGTKINVVSVLHIYRTGRNSCI